MRTYTMLATAVALTLTATQANAVTSVLAPYTLATTTYTQNFNTLVATGESNILPAGFQISEIGTGATVDGNYTAGTGSSATGDVYSFGSAALPADRALGTLFSGTNTPLFGFVFTNGLNASMTSLAFNFFGEQWRSVTGTTGDRLDFQYRLGGGAVDTGTWIDFDGLDILTRVSATTGAVDGNAAANRFNYTGTINGLTIGAGQVFSFRFVDLDVAGADLGLALDDLSVTATTNATPAVPEPATWGMMLIGFGAMGYVMRRRRATVGVRFA